MWELNIASVLGVTGTKQYEVYIPVPTQHVTLILLPNEQNTTVQSLAVNSPLKDSLATTYFRDR